MPDQLMFVQFPHPGKEHSPRGPEMNWNRGAHARKFLKAQGTYLANGVLHTGPFAFWGEWEPQSRVIQTFPSGKTGWPKSLHQPYWQVPAHRRLLQNTDPLVFGDRFLYSNCRQGQNSKLRALAPGSIILFGSKFHGQFVLDTLFVVGNDSRAFTRGSADLLNTPAWVDEVLFGPLRSSTKSPDDSFRLYRGVTYQDAPEGPFSFVPCRRHQRTGSAFERPAINLGKRRINANLAMNAKATVTTTSELAELWNHVLRQVVDVAGLSLGVRIDVPLRLPPE